MADVVGLGSIVPVTAHWGLLLPFAVFAICITSVLLFALDTFLDLGRNDEPGIEWDRLPGAITSLMSGVFLLLIYGTPTTTRLLQASNDSNDAHESEWLSSLASGINSILTWVTDHISIFGHRFVAPIDPPLLPLAVFLLLMALRSGIFVFAKLRGLEWVNLSGSVYWSHGTALWLAGAALVVGWGFPIPGVLLVFVIVGLFVLPFALHLQIAGQLTESWVTGWSRGVRVPVRCGRA